MTLPSASFQLLEPNQARTASIKSIIGQGVANSNFSNLKANDLMNKNPLTAIETDNLQLAETRMREAKVQCLVVKNKIDEVAGVIQIFE